MSERSVGQIPMLGSSIQRFTVDDNFTFEITISFGGEKNNSLIQLTCPLTLQSYPIPPVGCLSQKVPTTNPIPIFTHCRYGFLHINLYRLNKSFSVGNPFEVQKRCVQKRMVREIVCF